MMRQFTDGEQSVLNKVDRGDWIIGSFYLENARRLISEGILERVVGSNTYGFMSYPKVKFRRVK